MNIGLHDNSDSEDSLIKIYDFGLAHTFTETQPALMTNLCGTKGYMAPEITDGKYASSGGPGVVISPAIDIWAFGVILF